MEAWRNIRNDHVVRVTYHDTDQMGVVYYANYLVWFEIGRTELLRQTGSSYRAFEQRGFILPVIRCVCDYKRPARYDDLIRISTCISSLSRASISFQYRIFHHESNELLAEGETRHALTDRKGRLIRNGQVLGNLF